MRSRCGSSNLIGSYCAMCSYSVLASVQDRASLAQLKGGKGVLLSNHADSRVSRCCAQALL